MMKSPFSLVCAVLGSIAFLCSCSESQVRPYLIVRPDSDKLYGIANNDCEIIFADEFESEPTNICGDRFAVKHDDGYTVYTLSKSPREVPGLNGLVHAGCFAQENIAPMVFPGERISIYDKDGEYCYTLDPYDGKEIIGCANAFCEGLLIVYTEDEKAGAVDLDGNMVINPIFDFIAAFDHGYALAVSDESNYIINAEGEIAVTIDSPLYPLSYFVESNRLPVRNDESGSQGFISTDGTLFECPSKVSELGQFNSKYYVYRNDDSKMGVLRFGENKADVLRAKYEGLAMFNDGKAFVVLADEKFSVVSPSGETITKFNPDYTLVGISSDLNPVLIFDDGDENYIPLNLKGERISSQDFNYMSTYSYSWALNILSDFKSSDY